jgi:hypothetical protein
MGAELPPEMRSAMTAMAGGLGALGGLGDMMRRIGGMMVGGQTGAAVGLIFVLFGVTLTTVTGNPRWDGVGSLAIGVLLSCVAAILAVEMKSLLIGESASADVERAVVAAIETGPEARAVIHLRTLHVGPDTLLVTAKIAVTVGESAVQFAAGIDAAEQRIRAAVPIAQLIFLEPDLYREAEVDPADPAVRAARRSRSLLSRGRLTLRSRHRG